MGATEEPSPSIHALEAGKISGNMFDIAPDQHD
jgi:hypothetical protein